MKRAGWLGLAACLPAMLLPISNPDLFWHLSAARRLWSTGGVPREDWLSWTMAGVRWVDFEWLSQAAFGLAHAGGGLAGAWALKAALVAACAWRLRAWLKIYDVPEPQAAAGLALWAAAMLPRADLRPELFSALFFIELFRRLELWRLERRTPSLIVAGAAFALWANLHAGFAYGLALTAFYTLFGLSWRVLAVGAVATLLNPAGWRVYAVLAEHAADAGRLAHWIIEWRAPDPANPWRWAELALLPAAAAAAALAGRRGRVPHPAPALVLVALAAAGLRHARTNVYFASAAVPLALSWLADSGRRVKAALPIGVAAFLMAWSFWRASEFGVLTRVFEPRLAPVRAADFLEREAHVLAPRPLYNPWGWGGYLGWRLGGRYPVFQDGRYLFHRLLLEAGSATESPETWRDFLDARGVELALLENAPAMVPTRRRYPDGTERVFQRPYHVTYMPRERWALIYFDDQSLVFVRRDGAPRDWLAAREFRWLRPRDDAAFQDALSRGEIPEAELAAERSRLQ
ncbi:MAG: hypothetical protein HY553_19270 [Elusimicrobia bacterium]|nr:hypothetical protein [Elusimicrobiota bacterium]